MYKNYGVFYSIKTLKKSIKIKMYSITALIDSLKLYKRSLTFIDIRLLINFNDFLVRV